MVPAQFDVFLPPPLTGRGPSYTCAMLAQGLACPDLEVTVFTPRARSCSVAPARISQVLPPWARHVPYRWVRSLASNRLEATFLSCVKDREAQHRGTYIWPDASLKTIQELTRANIKVFREMVNCHRGTAKGILDEAYERLGTVPNHTISEVSVAAEQEALEAVDYIFCPNSMVEVSLLQHGVPASKMLRASYGWDPTRFGGSHKLLRSCVGITVVFAGAICVRKGAHLLLDYWARSKVRGRLVLAGAMESVIKEKCAHLLARDDVVVLDFIDDLGALYRSADLFAFPTLEEGGPQVTYEACGCGLPVVTTPMGAGRIVRHNREGFVLDPYDGCAWISAIRSLAENPTLRHSMGIAASERAQTFHWSVVARRRRHQVLDRLGSPATGITANGGPWDLDFQTEVQSTTSGMVCER